MALINFFKNIFEPKKSNNLRSKNQIVRHHKKLRFFFICIKYSYHTIQNTGKNISKKYSPIPRNTSENEPQATRLPLWQILPLPATGASQQDIRGIGKVKQC